MVFTTLKIADVNKAVVEGDKIKANGRCFTVVSVIANCWYMKLQHVRCI